MKRIIKLILVCICIIGTIGCAEKKETVNDAAIKAYSRFVRKNRIDG